jgi:hypothetical protein
LPPQPNRRGFTFVGWFDTSAGTGGTQFTAGPGGTKVTTDKWVHARWAVSEEWKTGYLDLSSIKLKLFPNMVLPDVVHFHAGNNNDGRGGNIDIKEIFVSQTMSTEGARYIARNGSGFSPNNARLMGTGNDRFWRISVTGPD